MHFIADTPPPVYSAQDPHSPHSPGMQSNTSTVKLLVLYNINVLYIVADTPPPVYSAQDPHSPHSPGMQSNTSTVGTDNHQGSPDNQQPMDTGTISHPATMSAPGHQGQQSSGGMKSLYLPNPREFISMCAAPCMSCLTSFLQGYFHH